MDCVHPVTMHPVQRVDQQTHVHAALGHLNQGGFDLARDVVVGCQVHLQVDAPRGRVDRLQQPAVRHDVVEFDVDAIAGDEWRGGRRFESLGE